MFIIHILMAVFTFNHPKSHANAAEIRQFVSSKVTIKNVQFQDNVTFKTDDESVSFFILGDWGGLPRFPYRTMIEKNTAKSIGQIAKSYNTKFYLGLGDNFYYDGVSGVNDKRFKETFEDVFNSTDLVNNPWFFVLGNHDHLGNANAQIDYTKKSKRWIFPKFSYSIDVLTDSGGHKLVTFLMIDTVLMCGNLGANSKTQPTHLSLRSRRQGAENFDALEKKLAEIASTSVPYIIVAGHFPVWSIGQHGPTRCLVNNLRPLLHKYGVAVYLSGHDHNLQFIEDTFLNKSVGYVVSGCSNFIDRSQRNSKKIPSQSLKFHWADVSQKVNGGFVVAQATANNLTLIFYETNSKSLYQAVIKPRF